MSKADPATTTRARTSKPRRSTPAPAPMPARPLPPPLPPRGPAPMHLPAAATIAGMGERIRQLCGDLDQPHFDGAPMRHARQRAEAERLALSELLLVQPARTLADAAVQADSAYSEAEVLAGADAMTPELRGAAERLRCSLASVGVAVCRDLGADPGRVGWGNLGDAYAREFGAVPPCSGPDTELIRLCTDYVVAEAEHRARYDGVTDEAVVAAIVADTAPLIDAQIDLVDRICALRATTALGILARAWALHADNGRFEHSFDVQL